VFRSRAPVVPIKMGDYNKIAIIAAEPDGRIFYKNNFPRPRRKRHLRNTRPNSTELILFIWVLELKINWAPGHRTP